MANRVCPAKCKQVDLATPPARQEATRRLKRFGRASGSDEANLPACPESSSSKSNISKQKRRLIVSRRPLGSFSQNISSSLVARTSHNSPNSNNSNNSNNKISNLAQGSELKPASLAAPLEAEAEAEVGANTIGARTFIRHSGLRQTGSLPSSNWKNDEICSDNNSIINQIDCCASRCCQSGDSSGSLGAAHAAQSGRSAHSADHRHQARKSSSASSRCRALDAPAASASSIGSWRTDRKWAYGFINEEGMKNCDVDDDDDDDVDDQLEGAIRMGGAGSINCCSCSRCCRWCRCWCDRQLRCYEQPQVTPSVPDDEDYHCYYCCTRAAGSDSVASKTFTTKNKNYNNIDNSYLNIIHASDSDHGSTFLPNEARAGDARTERCRCKEEEEEEARRQQIRSPEALIWPREHLGFCTTRENQRPEVQTCETVEVDWKRTKRKKNLTYGNLTTTATKTKNFNFKTIYCSLMILLLMILVPSSNWKRAPISANDESSINTAAQPSRPLLAQAGTTAAGRAISMKIGALFEESDHEQSSVFLRTIKMINEGTSDAMRQVLGPRRAGRQIRASGKWPGKGRPATARGKNQDQANLAGAPAPLDLHEPPPEVGRQSTGSVILEDQASGPSSFNSAALSNVANRKRDCRYSKLDAALETSNLKQCNLPWKSIQDEGAWEGENSTEIDMNEPSQVNSSTGTSYTHTPNRKGRSLLSSSELPVPLNYDEGEQDQREQDLWQPRVRLEPMVEFLTNLDSSFEADKCVCQLIESGVRTLLGPLSGSSIQHVQSICDNMELPYFQLRPLLGSLASSSSSSFHYSSLGAAGSNGWQANTRAGKSSAAQTSNPASQMMQDAPAMKDPSELPVDLHPANGNNETFSNDHNNNNNNNNNNPDIEDSDNGELELVTEQEPDLSIVIPSVDRPETTTSGGHGLNQRPTELGYTASPTVASFHDPPKAPAHASQFKEEHQQQLGAAQSEDLLALNLQPPAHLLTSAYIDLIYAWNWSSFAIIYEHESSMIKLQDLFRESSGSWTNRWKIKLFRFHEAPKLAKEDGTTSSHALNSNGDVQKQTDSLSGAEQTFRALFWKIKRSGERNIILDVDGPNLNEALKQAQQVGCMTDQFSFLLTSLDLHLVDLENYKYGRTRITALSLINLDSFEVHEDESSSQLDGQPRVNHLADESYLEQLGVAISKQESGSSRARYLDKSLTSSRRHQWDAQPSSSFRSKLPKLKLSPSIVLDKQGAFMDPPSEAFESSPQSSSSSSSLDSNGQGQSSQYLSGFQVASSKAEDELFHLLIQHQPEVQNLTRIRLSTTSAILHDSLVLLALGLRELDPNGSYLDNNKNSPQDERTSGYGSDGLTLDGTTTGGLLARQQSLLSCSLPTAEWRPWRFGSSLINYMRRLAFGGLTGRVSFDQRGLRTSFKVNVLGMASEIGLVKVGEWQSHLLNTSGSSADLRAKPSKPHDVEAELDQLRKTLINWKEPNDWRVPYEETFGGRSKALRVNRVIFERLYKEHTDQIDTLIVSTKLSNPYFMLKETPNKLEGNDQYEGFAVDLVHELSKMLNFRYRWREAADQKYGTKETLPNGTVVWNGVIGEIVRGQADLAIGDLTITAQREEAVDFTLPFMNTGISILFKRPTTKVTTLYSFLSPFSRYVWAYVLVAYCGISTILFLVGHLSPYEWTNPHFCPHLQGDGLLESMVQNQFTLPNSFWFTIGSLMQQGSDLTPRSMSTRTIAGIWYFFTLIMISSYTANLAAFLTVERIIYPIENVRDLANQNEIRYGCVESGSTYTFFNESQIDTYRQINQTMHKFHNYLKSNDEGQKRVEEGKFAFFMESTSIEYIIERNCNLTQIGGLLDSKGYGMATSKKSRHKRPYRTLLSEGILRLQESGLLHMLKNRWWKERRGGGTCTDGDKGGTVTELSLANVGGVFVVLVGGLCLAFLVAMGEFLWRSRRNGLSRNTLCDQMMNDLTFALNCTKSVRTLSAQERLAKRQRSLTRLNSSQRSQSQSESQSQLNSLNNINGNGNNNNNNNGNNNNGNNLSNLTHHQSGHWSVDGNGFQKLRKPLVGFSTSEELETPDHHHQNRMAQNQPNCLMNSINYHTGQHTGKLHQIRAINVAQQQHLYHQSFSGPHYNGPEHQTPSGISRASVQDQRQSMMQQNLLLQQQQQQQQHHLQVIGIPNRQTGSNESMKRRRLFAQQTVATIDDGSLWQQQ